MKIEKNDNLFSISELTLGQLCYLIQINIPSSSLSLNKFQEELKICLEKLNVNPTIVSRNFESYR